MNGQVIRVFKVNRFKRVKKAALPAVIGMAGLVLVASSPAQAAEEKTAPAKEPHQLVKVCTLASVEANQEFQRNVQIVQAQRQRIIVLQAQLAQAQTQSLKKALQKELDNELEKLNKNNEKMVETYGFSLNRNYVLVTEQAHVYMVVSDEEAAKVQGEE